MKTLHPAPHPDRVTYTTPPGWKGRIIRLDGVEVGRVHQSFDGKRARYKVSSAPFRSIDGINFPDVLSMMDFVTTRLWDQEVPA